MSSVPDLNGSKFNPSFVAYYNVIENTDLETIDDIRNLNNVLSGTIIESYTDDQGIVINDIVEETTVSIGTTSRGEIGTNTFPTVTTQYIEKNSEIYTI